MINNSLKLFPIIAFLLIINSIFCQNSTETDSLLKIIKSNKSDTDKIEAYSNLFFIYEFTDTVKAQLYLDQEVKLSEKCDNTKWLANAYGHYGFFCEDKSDLNGAIEYHQKSLKLYKENKSIDINQRNKNISACYNNIALIYGKLGIYNKALDFYLLSLQMDEALGDSLGISISYSNIGIIQRKLGDYDKALEYYFKSLKIVEKLDDKERMSSCYNNIGLAYQYKLEFEKAILYISKAIKIDEKTQDQNRLASCYNNLGNVYYELKDYNKCKIYYDKALDIRNKLGDKNGQSSVLGNIASLNNKLKQYDEAINNANKSISIAKEIGVLPWQRSAYATLSETYDSIENYKKAYKYYKLFKELNDSIFSIEKSRQVKGMEAKYENEKKQKEIELLNKDKQLQKVEIRQQNIIKYAFIIGFILMILLVSVVYKNYLNKQKANVLLSNQNAEILQQKEEITAQRDEIEAQRDEIAKHRDLVIDQKEEIEDSINYAKRIQEAVLPISDMSRAVLGEHFILFKPKDIVSGDFYFITEINKIKIIAVADCTGHGVPGAFMSMLGISFLNEIVRKKEVTQASHVLDQLRDSIIEALSQTGESGTQKDGMDISIIAIEKQITSYDLQVTEEESNDINPSTHKHISTFKAQWAGANNPLYIVKSLSSSSSYKAAAEEEEKIPNFMDFTNFQLYELKGDKMPIAIYEKMDSFTNHEIELHQGDCIYLMSDGYQDQFGGPKGKKFLSKNLKELLIVNCKLSMEEQKSVLEKTLVDWIGDGEQIDDVTILGIKI